MGVGDARLLVLGQVMQHHDVCLDIPSVHISIQPSLLGEKLRVYITHYLSNNLSTSVSAYFTCGWATWGQAVPIAVYSLHHRFEVHHWLMPSSKLHSWPCGCWKWREEEGCESAVIQDIRRVTCSYVLESWKSRCWLWGEMLPWRSQWSLSPSEGSVEMVQCCNYFGIYFNARPDWQGCIEGGQKKVQRSVSESLSICSQLLHMHYESSCGHCRVLLYAGGEGLLQSEGGW